MSGFYVSNKLQSYFNFSDEQIRQGAEKAVARIQGGVQSLAAREIKVIAASGFGCEYVGNVFRSDDTKAINAAIREDFLKAVRNACGVENDEQLPESVRSALKLNEFGEGLPLTARRIAAVKTALYGAADENENVWSGVAYDFRRLASSALLGEIKTMSAGTFEREVTKVVTAVLDRLHRQFGGQQGGDVTGALNQLDDFVRNDFLTALRSPSAFMISADDIHDENCSKPMVELFRRFSAFLNAAGGSNLLNREGGAPSIVAGGRKLLTALARAICSDDLALLKEFLPESAQGAVPGYGDVELDVLVNQNLLLDNQSSTSIPKGELKAIQREFEEARTDLGFPVGGGQAEFAEEDLLADGGEIGFSDVTRRTGVPSQDQRNALKTKFFGLCNKIAERTVEALIGNNQIEKKDERYGLIKTIVYNRALVEGRGVLNRPLSEADDKWSTAIIHDWLSKTDVETLKKFDACGIDLFRFQTSIFDSPNVDYKSFKPAYTALKCIAEDLVDAEKLKTAEGRNALLVELRKRANEPEDENADKMSDKKFGDLVTDLMAKIVRTNMGIQFDHIRLSEEAKSFVEPPPGVDNPWKDYVGSALGRAFRTLKQGLTTTVGCQEKLAGLMDKVATALVKIAREGGVSQDDFTTFANGMFHPSALAVNPRDMIEWLDKHDSDELVSVFSGVKEQLVGFKTKVNDALGNLETTLKNWAGEDGAKAFLSSMKSSYAMEQNPKFIFDWKKGAPDEWWRGKELPKLAQRANEYAAKLRDLETALLKELGEDNSKVVTVVMEQLAKDHGFTKTVLKNQVKLVNLLKTLTGRDRLDKLNEIASILRNGELELGGLFTDGKAKLRSELAPAIADFVRPLVNGIESLRPEEAKRSEEDISEEETNTLSVLVGLVTQIVNESAFADIKRGYAAFCQAVEAVHTGDDEQQRQNLKDFMSDMRNSKDLEVSGDFSRHLASHVPDSIYGEAGLSENPLHVDILTAAFAA